MEFEALISQHIQTFGGKPQILIQAPGRINLIGEHTDYNLGRVFPAAIDKFMWFAIGFNDEDAIQLQAIDLGQKITLPVDNQVRNEKAWVNYCAGILDQFQKIGMKLKGFDCSFGGNIPIGSGLSSSAALECGLATAINELLGLGLDKWSLAKMGQRSENEFVGTSCGILDQFASVFGKKDQGMMMDCRDHSYEYVPIHLEGYQWVLFNSMVKHAHLTSGYNDRPAECLEGLSMIQKDKPSIKSVRDLQIADIVGLPQVLKNRLQFSIEENERVLHFKEALMAQQPKKIGELLYSCHEGLDQLYEVSCAETNYLVDLARQNGVAGARMMGGGFGGCTLNLIENSQSEAVIQGILAKYKDKMGIEAEVYQVNITDGIKRIDFDANSV